jgi:hypothetical protein
MFIIPNGNENYKFYREIKLISKNKREPSAILIDDIPS